MLGAAVKLLLNMELIESLHYNYERIPLSFICYSNIVLFYFLKHQLQESSFGFRSAGESFAAVWERPRGRAIRR